MCSDLSQVTNLPLTPCLPTSTTYLSPAIISQPSLKSHLAFLPTCPVYLLSSDQTAVHIIGMITEDFHAREADGVPNPPCCLASQRGSSIAGHPFYLGSHSTILFWAPSPIFGSLSSVSFPLTFHGVLFWTCLSLAFPGSRPWDKDLSASSYLRKKYPRNSLAPQIS